MSVILRPCKIINRWRKDAVLARRWMAEEDRLEARVGSAVPRAPALGLLPDPRQTQGKDKRHSAV